MDDVSSDDSLAQSWQSFVKQCEQTAGWELPREQRNIKDIISKIQPPANADAETYAKSKEVFDTTLTFLERFGSIIASGVSPIFGASSQCSNALSMVIGTVRAYEQMYKDLTAVMENMTSFFRQLQTFLGPDDSELRLHKNVKGVVLEVLQHFLGILAISHKLSTDWKRKAKRAMALFFFSSDGGIKDALESLESLVNRFTRSQISDILRNNVDATTSMTHDVVSRMSDEAMRRQQLEVVRKALLIDDDNDYWTEVHHSLSNSCISGSGAWLLENPMVDSWSDINTTTNGILTIRDEQGFGKSHLCNSLIRHVQNRYTAGDARRRVLIGYYYFDGGNIDVARLSIAIKSIIWQFVKVDSEYANTMRTLFMAGLDFGDLQVLLHKLILDLAGPDGPFFFILLDGIQALSPSAEDVLADYIQKILVGHLRLGERRNEDTPLDRASVRLCLTAEPSALDILQNRPMKGAPRRSLRDSIPEINLEHPRPLLRPAKDRELRKNTRNKTRKTLLRNAPVNEADIRLVVQDRLHKTLGGQSHLLGEAQRVLAKNTTGGFYALEGILNDIRGCRHSDEVKSILLRTSEAREIPVSKSLANATLGLSRGEVRELQEIISWLRASGTFDVSLTVLEQALSLDSIGGGLGFLRDQIGSRYGEFLRIRPSRYDRTTYLVATKPILVSVFLQAGADEELEASDTSDEDWSSQGDDAVVPERLHKVETEVVKRVLLTFCGERIYNRFGFDSFFYTRRHGGISNQGKAGRQIGLRVSPSEAHLSVLKACLTILCDGPANQDGIELHDYAAVNIGYHLQAVALESLNNNTKKQIGKQILRLFHDAMCLDAWWTDERVVRESCQAWSLKEEHCNTVAKWLQDPAVGLDVNEEGGSNGQIAHWIQSFTTVSPMLVLEWVAELLAGRWIKEAQDEPASDQTLLCVIAFYSKVDSERCPFEPISNAKGRVTPQQVASIEQRLSNLCSDSEDKARCQHRLAKALYRSKYYSAALEHSQKATKLDASLWRAKMHQAETLAELGQLERAVSLTQELIADHEHLAEDSESRFRRPLITRILQNLAKWNLDLRRKEEALRVHKKAFELCIERDEYFWTAMDSAGNAIIIMHQLAQHENSLRIIRELDRKGQDEHNRFWLFALFTRFATNTGFHRAVRVTASTLQILDEANIWYVGAIQSLTLSTSTTKLQSSWLRLWCAQLEVVNMASAIDLLETARDDLLSHDRGIRQSSHLLRLINSQLGRAHTSTAQSEGLKSSIGTEHIDKMKALDLVLPIARLYTTAGLRNDAIELVRPRLLLALQRATHGEHLACARLSAEVFLALDDYRNAIAAWQYLFASLQIQSEETVDTNNVQRLLERDSVFDSMQCSARCGNELKTSSRIFVCKACDDCLLCAGCHNNVQAAGQHLYICQPDHERLEVLASDEQALDEYRNGHIKIGESFVPFQRWLDQVWKMWELDKAKTLQTSVLIIQRVYRAFLRKRAKARRTSGLDTDPVVGNERSEVPDKGVSNTPSRVDPDRRAGRMRLRQEGALRETKSEQGAPAANGRRRRGPGIEGGTIPPRNGHRQRRQEDGSQS